MTASAYRAATPGDAGAMAELVDIAGEGLPQYVWRSMAEPGQSVWDVGRGRARRETGGFSYRNATVREEDGAVVACLVGYPLADEPVSVDYDELPPMFVPLQQLEDLAPATWYVNVLATRPGYRGRGYGGALLEIAAQKAVAAARTGLSLIVSDANAPARSLYEHHGYREAAQRAMVKQDWRNRGERWLLLIKPLRG